MSSGNKFGRDYEVSIETLSGTTLTVGLPFTIEFDITRQILGSANVCQVRLYNLSEVNRNQIVYNAFNQTLNRAIILKAGYGDNLATIFTGNISQAWSVREGVNFISQIECYDGGFGFVNGDMPNIPFPAGTPIKTVITTIMAQIPGVTIGAVGNFPGTLPRAVSYSGNPSQILYEITGGAFFVDNGKGYALLTDEYITDATSLSEPVFIIEADTGLLNTPILEQSVIRFEMLFEPSLNVGRLVEVNSITNPKLNGTYKLNSVKHRGTISGVVSGSVITTAEMYASKEPVGIL